MNSTISQNQTFSFAVLCTSSSLGFLIQLSVNALDLIVLLPIQLWVVWLGISNVRIKGRLVASEIFTMNLSVLEVLVIILYFSTNVACAFYNQINQITILFVVLFSGCYLVGRPIMNCLICVERYMAVAHPVIYRSPDFVKHRYIGAGLVWLASVFYGGLAFSTYPQPATEVYIFSLTTSLLVITACSLGVLKVLLRPSPGETKKEKMHGQKKRALVIIIAILVCSSVPYGLKLFQFIIHNYLENDNFSLMASISFLIMQPSSVMQSVLYLSKRKKLPCTRKNSS